MSYIIKRTDQGGGYLAERGSKKSFTSSLLKARKFQTEKEADDERCKGNEIIIKVEF
jgi:hypothetical protein